MIPTIVPARTARIPPSRTLSLPPRTTAPANVSTAPTATKGVAAPAYRLRSSTAPAAMNTRPITSAVAAAASVVSSAFDNDEESEKPKFVELLELDTSPWNGMTFVLLSATSNVAQAAKNTSRPARKTARLLVQVAK